MRKNLAHRLAPVLLGWSLLLAGSGCQNNPPSSPAVQPASVETLKKSVYYLASEPLEGRGLGTQGLDLAGQYIAGYFRGLGLQPPPGQSDYLQHFTSTAIKGVDEKTTLKAGGRTYVNEVDFKPLALSAETSFDAPVVFVGYGISRPAGPHGEAAYDDYAGVDVAGKVALAMRYEPHDAQGKSRFTQEGWSDNAALMKKARTAAEHGAVALLVVHPPEHHAAESLPPLGRRMGSVAAIPVIQIRQKLADDLLDASGASDLKTFQTQIDASFSPKSFILKKASVAGNVAFKRATYDLKNVAAFLPGKGKYAKQVIVIGAHYDHLGRGGIASLAPGSNQIHYGADDNASGTAAVLELAKLFSHAGPQPRSLMFVTFSGEEEGLLGSQYWVEHPPVDLKRVVAMLNLDMVGRVRNDAVIVGGVRTTASFPAILQRADEISPLQVKATWDNGVAPSDNTSFVLRRIPVLFFFTGNHSDYHRPTDTADKINYQGEAQLVDLVAQVVRGIVAQKDLSFAEMPTTAPTTRATDSSLRSGGASLGVVPDYGDDAVKGVKITGTSPSSPAAKAGLLPGDILVEIDGRKVESIYDLTEILNTSPPGKTVPIKVLRDGKTATVQATFGERRGQ
jgi:Zn-dependent M28 family amino/carboxypeptidase